VVDIIHNRETGSAAGAAGGTGATGKFAVAVILVRYSLSFSVIPTLNFFGRRCR
jgi:hypothetical protein